MEDLGANYLGGLMHGLFRGVYRGETLTEMFRELQISLDPNVNAALAPIPRGEDDLPQGSFILTLQWREDLVEQPKVRA